MVLEVRADQRRSFVECFYRDFSDRLNNPLFLLFLTLYLPVFVFDYGVVFSNEIYNQDKTEYSLWNAFNSTVSSHSNLFKYMGFFHNGITYFCNDSWYGSASV